MKKEKHLDVFVYFEKGRVAVTLCKVILEDGFQNSYSKQHVVNWRLPFFYKAHRHGTLSIGRKADIAEINKGDTIKINKDGDVVLTSKKRKKSLRKSSYNVLFYI